MDKMIDSPWMLRIVALFLACLLFFSVHAELSDANESAGTDDVEVIRDVPLEVFYDDENLIVTGLPKTVNVTIEGPRTFVLSMKYAKDFSIFVDLNHLLLGEHTVEIQYENISEKLQVTLDPATVDVKIEEKITQEFRVDPEMNHRLIEDGYVLKGMTAEPATVFITGAKSVIESISYVKATVKGEEGLNQSFSQDADVKVLDRDLNKLDVLIEQGSVNVKVDIAEYSKELPLSIHQIGTAPEGVTINSLTTNVKTVKVYGKKSIIDLLNEITVEVDVSQITEAKTYEFEVKLPEGTTKVSEPKIKVKADITKVEEVPVMDSEETDSSTTTEDIDS
ncbi:hypothetical protein AEA09_15255 [Lysinibacillus contaminans]|uniref:YbbR-like domain-containing protein YbbR n=1 Tax=Lysinibacillus contaminans TaxID=1293441 RepID=A0ABR5JX88_9BACI|nr:CdaR family protein [Lysinibacillus contaminans]KOS66863.1 hypothetical protein AEA09_15255 [Lysinibacillus contaminans]